MLIFGSGKVVFTGAKCREDVNTAHNLIEPVLRKHIKKIHLKDKSNLTIKKIKS